MAERPGDPDALGRIPVNRAIVERLRAGAEISAAGVGPWSPDGYVMRTHPDLTEVIDACAPDDLQMVLGMATLVGPAGVIYAVGLGTSGLWLRMAPDRAPAGALDDDVEVGAGIEAIDA